MAHIIVAMNYSHLQKYFVVFCLLSGSALAAPHALVPKSVVVITSESRPVRRSHYVSELLQQRNVDFSQYSLDAITALESHWSQGLPVDKKAAQAVFEQRLAAVGNKAFETELIRAYKGLSTAVQYRIDRYPAIIFDEQYVIYGINDLNKALQIYSAFVQKQGALYE